MQPNGGRWWQATGLGLILLTGAGLVAWAEQNDSGQNQCYDGHDMVACTEATSGDQAPHPRQDGRYGRDAQGEHLTKTGGGLAGFDFSPLDAQGQPIPLLEGVPVTPPACTRDNLTGLTWEIKTQDRGLRDQDWTYAEQQATGDPCGASLGAQGCDPAAYGAAVNAQGLCGAHDWRLPSVTELRSLVDAGGFDPALDAAYFPHSPSGPYRTATPGPGPGQSWVVHFRDGQATPAPNDQPQHLRLVRGPGAPPSSHAASSDGTISQTPSGLLWAPCSEGQSLPGCLGQARPMTWAQALLTARGAQLAGYRDWRLPSRVELATLVDRDRQGPAIDGAHFPNTPPAPYWTSTSLMADPSQAWSIDFQDGADQGQDKQSLGYLRLVRAGTIDGLAMTDTQGPAGDDPSAPAARTGPAPVVTAANAWITGTVDDRGNVTQVRFEYGPTDRYGATITANPTSLGAGSGATAVNATLSGLSCGTLYHYRVKADNAAGTRMGEDQRFTTAACVSDGVGLTAKAQAETPEAREAVGCGVNWQSVNPLPQGNGFSSVVYGNGLFVAVGYGGTILTSPDGVTWTLRTSGTDSYLEGVTWSGSQFVAVGNSGTILTSPDGVTWTLRRSGTGDYLYGVTRTGIQFVAVGWYGTILTSPDGVTWTWRASDTTNHLHGVTWSGSQFVAVGGNTILTSPDGVTWTLRTSGTGSYLEGVTWSDSQFVAVGLYGTILTSPDGMTWTSRSSGTTDELYGVAWGGGQFVAVGYRGTILTSPNGATWTSRTSGTTSWLQGVTWSGSQFVAVGWDRTILTNVCMAPPTVTTSTAYPITTTGATLRGNITANGATTTASFVYGPTTSYGNSLGATPGNISGTAGGTSISASLTGLTCNTTYHYRAKGVNSIGTGLGGDQTFTTGACVPTATTNAATSVTAMGATLNGALVAGGASTTAIFEYGPTTSYGHSIAGTPGTIDGTAGSTAISASLTGLTCNTTYHYRAKGVSNAGSGLGEDRTFKTTVCVPTATTEAATGISSTTVTVHGTVNDNGGTTTVVFQWGETTAYGNSLNASPGSVAAGAGSTSVSGVLSGLASNRTYHYRVKAQNSGGISYGGDQSVTPHPEVVSLTIATGGGGQGRVTSNPAGIYCGSDCTETYPWATPVTLTAQADPGSTFTGWRGYCVGTSPTCFINLASNSTVTAIFEPSRAYTCGMEWQQANSLPPVNFLNSVAYADGVFGAVGRDGTILTSPDGVTWTKRTSGTTIELNGVTWSGSQFVAVGYDGTILTSPDGVSWTLRTSGNIYDALYDVTWGGSQFVAVGYWGKILTSPDGVTWTSRTSGTTSNLHGVTWSGSQFVAVGTGGTILTSPNGVTWTRRGSNTTDALYGVTWSGSQLVAVGGTILTSPDGVTWTPRALDATYGGLKSVTWSSSQFVAVGTGVWNGTSWDQGILTSPDGETWTSRTSGTTSWLQGVTWSGSQFVAVGNSGTILTSPDGVAWTMLGTAEHLSAVTWSGGQFVTVGYNGTILTSSDGTRWPVRKSGTTNRLNGVTWSGSQFVAVGDGWNGTSNGPAPILTSADGVTWTLQASGTTKWLNGVTWSGSQFVAVGSRWNGTSYGQAVILTSPNGETWTSRTSGTTNTLFSLTWSGSQFVAVGSSGTILTSPDGVTWTSRTSGITNDLTSVTWSGSQFVAVGSSGTILTSPDGVTWTSRTSGTSNYLFGVTWSGSEFVAVGTGDTILTSPDGVAWTLHTSGTSDSLSGVTWSGSQFVAVGSVGMILTSACPAPIAPSATTLGVDFLTATTAILNGTIDPKGASTTATFEYGSTTSYGSVIAAAPGTIDGSASSTAISASMTGLNCNTTYHYRAKGVSSTGTGLGGDQTFTTSACPVTPPTAITGVASGITATGATLNGTGNANGADATVSFQYGSTTSYGSSIGATPGSIAASAGETSVSASLSGLTCNSTYHYRAKGVNNAGTGYGEDVSFTTAACPATAPTATTSAATNVTETVATLNGTLTPNGADTTASFDYGPTTSYGSNLAATPAMVGAAAGNTAISAGLTGLTCNSIYYYRAKGLNSAGTGLGEDQTFTTAACSATAPTATTSAATNVTATAATFNGTLYPNGATTTASFDYGPTTSYGASLAATPGSISGSAGSTAIAASLTGLTCNSTYHYRARGLNSAGTGLGGDQSFTTGACSSTCTPGAILMNTPTTLSGLYSISSAQSIITSASVEVQTGADVTFAAPSIQLGPGFRVALGAKFRGEARTVTCP